ncbi:MAG: NAD+ synthase [Nitrosopumilus sp.]|nr:NAD+ synthase [Nitrosopumilus sp.]CAI9831402.1 NH(3)-dependent NAD(+) synthetase [Nitrosopumilaceae archaeon]MDA7940863.1 NAD+ synthase [Nitrosopumilus sp.]MDA7943281.1 NAD+ synthase [Nitrosopumilus sp.]MDA7944226.1 NAD+ synthase [Nitrosopumilus sp.]
MGVIPEITGIDYAAAAGSVSSAIRGAVRDAGARGAVFGLSGGVDSAVLAYSCASCIREGALALVMPDPSVTPRSETDDALAVASGLGIAHKTVDIGPVMAAFAGALEPDRRAEGNLRARARAAISYYFANSRNLLVLGSSDRSEVETGYFTKFGDGASDLAPLAGLYKLQVRGLARHLGVPDRIISKRSSPHLWPGHDAEGELGMSYEELDSVLYCMDNGMPEGASGVSAEKIARVGRLRRDSAHKRGAPC